MRNPIILALAGALLLSAAAASAQDDMSVEEIRSAFERQVQAFGSVKTRGLGGGQDRGLKLITVDDIKTDDQGEQVVVTVTPTIDTTTETAAATGSTVEETTTETAGTTAETTTGSTGSESTTGATISTTTVAGTSTASGTDTDVTLASATDPNKPLVYGQFKPELQVNLQIEFGFDSAALDSSQKPKLEKMCIVLQTSPINKIRIVGHTDTKGTDEYNERLSILRAREVARHLAEECGIATTRMETLGLGERFPINANNPQADENRRVEFQALS